MKTMFQNLMLTTALLLVLPALAAVQADATSTPPAEQTTATETKTAESDASTPKSETKDEAQSEHVARASFTSKVVENEPVDALETVPADTEDLYFFTEIVDLEGQTILHRWMFDGEVVAEIPIEIGGPRWRVHSIKTLPESPSGTWTVQVVANADTVLHESSIAFDSQDDDTKLSSASR